MRRSGMLIIAVMVISVFTSFSSASAVARAQGTGPVTDHQIGGGAEPSWFRGVKVATAAGTSCQAPVTDDGDVVMHCLLVDRFHPFVPDMSVTMNSRVKVMIRNDNEFRSSTWEKVDSLRAIESGTLGPGQSKDLDRSGSSRDSWTVNLNAEVLNRSRITVRFSDGDPSTDPLHNVSVRHGGSVDCSTAMGNDRADIICSGLDEDDWVSMSFPDHTYKVTISRLDSHYGRRVEWRETPSDPHSTPTNTGPLGVGQYAELRGGTIPAAAGWRAVVAPVKGSYEPATVKFSVARP